MNMPAFELSSYCGNVFRNIFTCPGQDLYDDISDIEDYPIVDDLAQLTSGIDHDLPQYQRPFQYGNLIEEDIKKVFQEHSFKRSRFADGISYGVWYAAEQEITSIYEACYWTYRLGADNVHLKGEVYTSERVMYQAALQSDRTVDLTGNLSLLPFLIDPMDYSFCQTLGKKLYKENIEVLRTLSARKKSEICLPTFSPRPIKNPQILYYLQIHTHPSGLIGVNSSKAGMNFTLSFSEISSPYS